MNECFYAMYKTSLRFAASWETFENSLLIYFQSHSVPFRPVGLERPREASRLEAKTHEAEAGTHEAEAEATSHEAEAEAEARFFGLEAEARPRGLTSLVIIKEWHFWQYITGICYVYFFIFYRYFDLLRFKNGWTVWIVPKCFTTFGCSESHLVSQSGCIFLGRKWWTQQPPQISY